MPRFDSAVQLAVPSKRALVKSRKHLTCLGVAQGAAQGSVQHLTAVLAPSSFLLSRLLRLVDLEKNRPRDTFSPFFVAGHTRSTPVPLPVILRFGYELFNPFLSMVIFFSSPVIRTSIYRIRNGQLAVAPSRGGVVLFGGRSVISIRTFRILSLFPHVHTTRSSKTPDSPSQTS